MFHCVVLCVERGRIIFHRVVSCVVLGNWVKSCGVVYSFCVLRGECPGKTPNWDAPKQCLELLLRTLPVLQPPLESGLSLLERGCDSSVSVDKSRRLQRCVSNDIEEPVEGFHRGVTFGGNEHQSGRVRTDLMTLT